ncbi:MAG: LamG domain-containing protein, partial [Candidatus Delongbacteria bacterium]|nr:LamG domain-containing protein [Candidatus Delongbacteria bacterium]
YIMRDWAEVARYYDLLVFDLHRQGEYLPLVELKAFGRNYPADPAFGLHTVVGTPYPQSGEAINALPAVIGASLAGIDKRNQFGTDWVRMCRDYYNLRPEENIYLNHPVASSGDDWWYETMPNVFFIQLMALYPETEGFEGQLQGLADQWLKAVRAMGGHDAPWAVPMMDYRAWRMADMTPNASGVHQPEAAGAIAWILYQAYRITGHSPYRVGAELAMEYLNRLNDNPAYELQLAYGVYMAARMNAELGTDYNLEKMVNWCFDPGYLRNWGMIVGRWGDYDCHGLIGEISSNDYAFCMNTFEQIGALVPAVRYRDDLAAPIAKWVLHAANNARLFYRSYLPVDHQDSETWSLQYDSACCIAYEALRKYDQGRSPFATGDAVRGGWGATNLALYGSSHVGILGGIIRKTPIDMILDLDLLKTDYNHAPAYPTRLIYNPYDDPQMVKLELEDQSADGYDAVTNRFIFRNQADSVSITLDSGQACLLVCVPVGGQMVYDHNRLLIDGVVVDYQAHHEPLPSRLRIKSVAAADTGVTVSDSIRLYCTLDGTRPDSLVREWECDQGHFISADSTALWQAPDYPGLVRIRLRLVSPGLPDLIDSTAIRVHSTVWYPPRIDSIRTENRKILPGESIILTCWAVDPENGGLQYEWDAAAGRMEGDGSVIRWQAPEEEGAYSVRCRVRDADSMTTQDSLLILVRDYQHYSTGTMIAYYPFNNNYQDESGNGHHASASQVPFYADRFGNPASAAWFNGNSSWVRIAAHEQLNGTSAITAAWWIRIDSLYEREAYPISHGNWENRWKVSLTNRRIRWTIRTDRLENSGIQDLDSHDPLEIGRYYHVAVMYDGSWMEIYINGRLDRFAAWSGSIRTTSLDLVIGQALPQNYAYGFRGIMDEVALWDCPLSPGAIDQWYRSSTGLNSQAPCPTNSGLVLRTYPNPFCDRVEIDFRGIGSEAVVLDVYNLNGERVRRMIVRGSGPSLPCSVEWD